MVKALDRDAPLWLCPLMPPADTIIPASIAIDNVAVVRGNRMVLQGFSMRALPGEIIWIRGANGAGKSTLLRMIAGLLPLVAGECRVEGGVALSDENLALDGNLPLEKALRFWMNLDGRPAKMLDQALGAMQLLALTDVPVRYLSSGQRRRASIARVITSGAANWLLDEPYNGVDNANSARLDEALLRHTAAGGIALVASHQPPGINVAAAVALDNPPVPKRQEAAR